MDWPILNNFSLITFSPILKIQNPIVPYVKEFSRRFRKNCAHSQQMCVVSWSVIWTLWTDSLEKTFITAMIVNLVQWFAKHLITFKIIMIRSQLWFINTVITDDIWARNSIRKIAPSCENCDSDARKLNNKSSHWWKRTLKGPLGINLINMNRVQMRIVISNWNDDDTNACVVVTTSRVSFWK